MPCSMWLRFVTDEDEAFAMYRFIAGDHSDLDDNEHMAASLHVVLLSCVLATDNLAMRQAAGQMTTQGARSGGHVEDALPTAGGPS